MFRSGKRVSFSLKAWRDIQDLPDLWEQEEQKQPELFSVLINLKAEKYLLKEKKYLSKYPVDAIKSGIGYLSQDRKRYGLALGLPVFENMMMGNYRCKISNMLMVQNSKVKNTAEEEVKSLDIKTPSINQLSLRVPRRKSAESSNSKLAYKRM